MAENENQAVQAKKDKKSEKKPGFFARVGKWFRDMKSELKKVQWPTRKQTINNTLIVIVCSILAWVLPFVIFIGIFKALEWSMFGAVMIALFVAVTLKSAFIDSYMMVKMMVSYMEVAPSTEITFDLYEKLCKFSSKFKELFGKAKTEGNLAA